MKYLPWTWPNRTIATTWIKQEKQNKKKKPSGKFGEWETEEHDVFQME